MKHLRHSQKNEAELALILTNIVGNNPHLVELLTQLQEFDLPDWLLVSGAIYNNVWNHLTDRNSMTGVKDFDVFYFDASDLSYEAEDKIIQRGAKKFAGFSRPVEIRNQARAHLWVPQKFGFDLPPLKSSGEMLQNFASRTHAVGVGLNAKNEIKIVAPFGLSDIFSFRLTPNYNRANRATYEQKASRLKKNWPELNIVPW
ncbi:hypothetical protein MNBD_ALPHA11-1091 [hydrothermal vent metagenome]|uniref:Nucleotidyltransferase family protein n=1 Tax=hydrothermal vent metagenome TaxID=652676 RepID=A0A3B0TNG2_9ZZZZ